MSVFIKTLTQNGISVSLERLYLVYALIDAIGQENAIHAHPDLNCESLHEEGIQTIKGLLTGSKSKR